MVTSNRQSAPPKKRPAWLDGDTRPMDLMDVAPPTRVPVGEATELTGRDAVEAVLAADRANKRRAG